LAGEAPRGGRRGLDEQESVVRLNQRGLLENRGAVFLPDEYFQDWHEKATSLLRRPVLILFPLSSGALSGPSNHRAVMAWGQQSGINPLRSRDRAAGFMDRPAAVPCDGPPVT